MYKFVNDIIGKLFYAYFTATILLAVILIGCDPILILILSIIFIIQLIRLL
jgi:hypothetical protein